MNFVLNNWNSNLNNSKLFLLKKSSFLNLKIQKKTYGIKKKHNCSIFMGNFYLNHLTTLKETSQFNKSFSLCSIVIDGNNLNLKREDIFNENFLFSPQTTTNSEVEMEIEEIEDDEYRYSAWKNTQIGLAVGGSALGMWFAYNGLNAWERWMKEQEKKDIEEEIEMTGTYINPGAGNVEASIDPITGKKIQIKNLGKQDPEKKKTLDNENSEKKE
mmetsp:Transcript_33808/g.67644  ORF Transcript_33808/g.67644 Transcript_33808/m.67644 type:complete len:215 (-) Transcript_33808:3545-4189(-)